MNFISIIFLFYSLQTVIAATTTTRASTTLTPKPGWATVCNMQFGFSYINGVLVCLKDSYGQTRNATEVYKKKNL